MDLVARERLLTHCKLFVTEIGSNDTDIFKVEDVIFDFKKISSYLNKQYQMPMSLLKS